MADVDVEYEAEHRRAIVSPVLRLTFGWAGDRWRHALEVGPPPDRVCVAESVEGDAPPGEPGRAVSPAYQQFHWQRDEHGVKALLVGQSGPHHYSAVFAVEEDPEGATVTVDVADRCRMPAAMLACTYVVHATSGNLIDAAPERIAWLFPGLGRGDLEFLAAGPFAEPTHLGLAEAGRRDTRVQAVAANVPGLLTRRCIYRWRWSGPRPRAADGSPER